VSTVVLFGSVSDVRFAQGVAAATGIATVAAAEKRSVQMRRFMELSLSQVLCRVPPGGCQERVIERSSFTPSW
jgi:hypothetical protein